ncbi:MAG: UDP-glucose 4-epimerase [Rhodospirillaceae bacterium]|nr:UDP-glucose 4-epimerase [Rhodospirillaceae bacterium]
MEHVLITGGAGYVGSLLCPQLLRAGYKVTALDACYFGDDFLPNDDPNFTLVKGDIRDSAAFEDAVKGVDMVIHLACISNDASFQLDERLSTTINLDAFEPLVAASKAAGVRRFIYASTSSVYGVSDKPNVTEDHPLVPLTLYNDFKGRCEPQLFKYQDDTFTCVTIRPATLCGYAPRQRLDLTVNILTSHAVRNGKITVFGGTQLRPNLHVRDMCNLYETLLTIDDGKIAGKTFNCGFQNMSVMELAEIVKAQVEKEFPDRPAIEIVTTPTDDIRSYHINSDKIRRELGFEPQFTIEDAVHDLCQAYKDGLLPLGEDEIRHHNVKTMMALGVS